MGRRKIEIKPIRDDRNRSVTFLKRKGGLFKKAHELSVLCSVDVAVIIFGQNKKLYEFSSGDINQTLARYQYYGGAHEHKGPEDFQNKAGGGDDDEEDEDGANSPPQEDVSPPHHGVPQHTLHHTPQLQHMNRATPSNSPPLPTQTFVPRINTPPQGPISRPSSRAHLRKPSSNLVPADHPRPHASQVPLGAPMGFPYQQHAPQYYHPQQAHMQQASPPVPQHAYLPQHVTQGPPQPHAQMQQMYQYEQRRQGSMPPAGYPPQPTDQHHGSPQPRHMNHTPPTQPRAPPPPGAAMHPPAQQQQPPHQQPPPTQQQQQQQSQQPQQPQPLQAHPPGQFRSPNMPESNLRPNVGDKRSHSVFTPVDDERSVLARFWTESNAQGDSQFAKPDPVARSQSADTSAQLKQSKNSPAASVPNMQRSVPVRAASTSDASPGGFATPKRTDSMQSDAKRPRLKVHIPDSEGSGADESSTRDLQTNETTTPIKLSAVEGGRGIVLPAPSPRSAGGDNLLSAGATGPPNPFSRPLPPHQHLPPASAAGGGNAYRDGIDTPMSALPSRVMEQGGYNIGSPSAFFPDSGSWFSGVNHFGNSLASPATYQPTPITTQPPSFKDDAEKRRKADEMSEEKKIKA